MKEDLKESSEHHPWNINLRFRRERWQEIHFVTLNRRERKEKPWHRQPNTKHQATLQQISRREDIHMVQAAINRNSEIVFDRDHFWTPRRFRKIAGEKTHYIETKRVTLSYCSCVWEVTVLNRCSCNGCATQHVGRTLDLMNNCTLHIDYNNSTTTWVCTSILYILNRILKQVAVWMVEVNCREDWVMILSKVK